MFMVRRTSDAESMALLTFPYRRSRMMPETTSLPPDAQARLEMLERSLSQSPKRDDE